jgi:hypothetical protein
MTSHQNATIYLICPPFFNHFSICTINIFITLYLISLISITDQTSQVMHPPPLLPRALATCRPPHTVARSVSISVEVPASRARPPRWRAAASSSCAMGRVPPWTSTRETGVTGEARGSGGGRTSSSTSGWLWCSGEKEDKVGEKEDDKWVPDVRGWSVGFGKWK